MQNKEATNMTVKEQLIAAKALIDKPEKWCQGNAIDAQGRICASQALRTITGGGLADAEYEALADAMAGPGSLVCAWNDTHTHAEVIAAFDRAIAAQRD